MTGFQGYDDEQYVEDVRMAERTRPDIVMSLNELKRMIEDARSLPMSSSIMVVREDALDIIDAAVANLPEEIREARWQLRDREALHDEAMAKAQRIMDQVRAEAARMVDKQEIVRQSKLRAEQIIAESEAQARDLINKAEDYVDSNLARFEIVLERLLAMTQTNRQRFAPQHDATTGTFGEHQETEFFTSDQPTPPPVPPAAPAPAPYAAPQQWESSSNDLAGDDFFVDGDF
jgi:hypothetical protein